jgi:hypothetical protein
MFIGLPIAVPQTICGRMMLNANPRFAASGFR